MKGENELKKVSTDSNEYKSMIRLFVSERDGRFFSYRNFVAWSTNKECSIVSHCGNSSMGQAIFASILKHEYELDTTYRYTAEGQLETLYQIENVKGKKVLFKRNTTPNLPIAMEEDRFEKLSSMN